MFISVYILCVGNELNREEINIASVFRACRTFYG